MQLIDKLAGRVVRARRTVIVAVSLLTVVAGFGATKLRLNADFSTYLNASDPLVQAYNDVGERFAGNSIGVVLVTAPDVFAPDVLSLIDRLTKAYRSVDGIAYTVSLTNVVDFTATDWGLEVGRLVAPGALPQTPGDVARLKERVTASERFVGNLVSDDGTAAALFLRFAGDDADVGISQFRTANRAVAATAAAGGLLPAGTEVFYGGMPFLISNMTVLISDNMKLLSPLMVIVLTLILYVGLRRWGGFVYPLTVVLVSTVWTVGFMGYLGLRIDLLSGIMPVVLIALGSADGIHYMKRFYERRAAGDSNVDAARLSAGELGVPLVITTITTMAGFASLSISDFVVIRQFGLLTALGLFLALVITLTLLPALASYGAGRPLARAGKNQSSGTGLTRAVGRVVYRRTGLVVAAGVVLALAGAVAIPRVVKDVDWTLCLQRGSAPFHAEMLLRQKFGGSLPVQIVVDGDLRDPAVLRVMRRVERRLDALPAVSNVQSMAGVIAEMNDVLNGRYTVPRDRAGVGNLWFLVEDEDMLEQLVAEGDRRGLIQARVATWHSAAIARVVDGVAPFVDALPKELVTLDLDQVPTDRRDAALRARRAETGQWLAWDLAKRDLRVDQTTLDDLLSQLDSWRPATADFAVLRDTLFQYATSAEAEIPLGPAAAGRVAEAVTAVWRRRESVSADTLTAVVMDALPAANPDDAAAFSLSLLWVSRETVATARIAPTLAGLERLVPTLRTDPTLRRNVRGTLWEAIDPWWIVDAAEVERLVGAGVGLGTGPVTVGLTRAGMASVLKQMEDELTPTQLKSLLMTLVFVAIVLALLFRSPVAGGLLLVPLLVTIIVNFGVMGYAGIGLDSFTAMIASIAIGLGVDYAIHFAHRFRREMRANEQDARRALDSTLATSGVAIGVNALSVGLGFLVLLAAGGQHIQRFGGLASLTMLLAAGLTLTVLPALFLWLRPRFLQTHGARAGAGSPL